ncbi:tyrosine/phenylalanine carboxypeptidase domain-containing protein [Brevundimonas sp.]|uniref:tyrosine/phenylalanine carboxypeptidase domain-containing protein n=1 Tax=Brevundimonas sp. TaxID=1871086 RepID=UPI003FA5D180
MRGLLELLDHLSGGGALDSFWMGKIASSHLSVMQELSLRGLLKPPKIMPQFLDLPGANQRLARLKTGLSPLDLIAA